MSINIHSLVSFLSFSLTLRRTRKIQHPSIQDIYNTTNISLYHVFGDNEVSALQVKHVFSNLYNINITMVHPTNFYKHKDTLTSILHHALNNTDFSFEVKTSIKPYER